MTQLCNQGRCPSDPRHSLRSARRSTSSVALGLPQAREKSIRLADGAFDAFMATPSLLNHDVNITNNTFNWQLQEYRKAVARLEQYV